VKRESLLSLFSKYVSTNLLLCNVIEKLGLDGDLYLHTHTTNPLLKVETIENCIKTYLENKESNDSLFTVKCHHTRFYTKDSLPMNHDPENLIPTQELDPIYEENSCLYVVPIETIKKYKRRISNNPYLYVMDDIESQDIDWEDDFKTTEALVKYRSNLHNNGKVVIVTGCNGGIGEALAKKYRTEGWIVVGVDIKKPNFKQNMYLNSFIELDLTRNDAPDVIYDLVKENYNRLDCIINNASIQVNKCANDTTLNDWEKVMNCNLRISMFLGQKMYLFLKDSSGSIVNVSSVHATQTSTNIAAYATAKGGLTALTRAMSLEYAKDNIRVNCILPGAIDTPMLRDGLSRGHTIGTDFEEIMVNFKNKHPLGRIGKPEEIAELSYFLSNNSKAGFFTGQCLTMDGGVTIRLSTE
jgi:NAD(P)-dependent dehydrogenase (short-subunit alcohol dehydrogenase family)